MTKTLATVAAFGLAAFAAIAPGAAGAAPIGTWYGTFAWEESLGRIGGSTPEEGTAAFVTHTLRLGPSAGSTGCMLRSEGFQTYDRMQCTATPEGESVVVKFYSFRPGRYPSGTPLFRITRTENGLMTRLQALEPTSDRTARSGPLFRRIG